MSLWLLPEPLVLASKSPARRAVLEAAGIPIEVRPADIDERAIEGGMASTGPGDVAVHLARAKAADVAARMPDRVVVGADQTLVLGTQRFTKPADRAAARAQLKALGGRTHELHSGVAVARNNTVLFDRLEVARLTMRALSDTFLDRYLDAAGDAVSASVGAYQLERTGVHLFARVEGDHFTILGLPLLPLLEFFRQQGFVA
jgi:septum formation protein